MEELLLDQPALRHGGMGRERRFNGVPVPGTIWSPGNLMSDPDAVPPIHVDDIAAGASAVGGCCGTRPAHTTNPRALIDRRP